MKNYLHLQLASCTCNFLTHSREHLANVQAGMLLKYSDCSNRRYKYPCNQNPKCNFGVGQRLILKTWHPTSYYLNLPFRADNDMERWTFYMCYNLRFFLNLSPKNKYHEPSLSLISFERYPWEIKQAWYTLSSKISLILLTNQTQNSAE